MPTRKNLRLPEYEYSTPGAYFVTVCTLDKTPILGRVATPISPPPVGADDHIGPHTQLSEIGKVVDR